MKRLIIATTGLALCAPVFAQGGTITTPKGGLKTEGPSIASAFGRYKIGRYHLIDALHVGKTAYTITEIAFRLDNWNHSRFTAMGRTWSNVKLSVSETTFSRFSRAWSSNITGPTSVVHNAKASWPTQTGFPLLKPDVWGGLAAKLRFPFSKPWVYTGKKAMLFDYMFRGGVMANNAAWQTSTTGSFPAYSYYLDSEYHNTFSRAGSQTYVPTRRINCNDSGMTRTTGAYMISYGATYGAESTVITYRNKLYFYHYSFYTAQNAPVIHALSLGGSTAGVNIGAKCNKLYVDLSKPHILIPLKTLKANTSGYSGLMGWLIPWNNALNQARLFLQGAWNDSQTKQLALTQARDITLPNGLPPAVLPAFSTLYYYNLTRTTGFGPYRGNGGFFPYTRYKHK